MASEVITPETNSMNTTGQTESESKLTISFPLQDERGADCHRVSVCPEGVVCPPHTGCDPQRHQE